MKSTVVCLRLNPEELAWLDKFAANYCTRSEYLRYLLHSEKRKRSGAKVTARDYQSDFRAGRPLDESV